MDLVLKKNFIDKIFLILLIFISVSLYWFFFDISGRIYPDYGERLSNLYKYNDYYYSFNLEYLLNEKVFNDFNYYFSTFLLKELGIKFEFFIFFLFCIYLLIVIKIFEKLSKSKTPIFLAILIIMLSIIWMDAIIGATVRQGCAFIFLTYALIINDKKNIKINCLLYLVALSFHFSAIIFFPIFFVLKFFEKRIRFLDIIFVLSIIFYIFEIPLQLSGYIYEIFLNSGLDFRSLQNKNHPTAGFSIYKLIALLFPIILFFEASPI